MTERLIPAAQLAANARTPFPGSSTEYDAARQALLAEEIEFRRHVTRLGEQRRALPLRAPSSPRTIASRTSRASKSV